MQNEVENLIHASNKTIISINRYIDKNMLEKYDSIIYMENGKIESIGKY
jgi:ABC-type Fe3+/spermidine/putrescine transport system ATPase subunit